MGNISKLINKLLVLHYKFYINQGFRYYKLSTPPLTILLFKGEYIGVTGLTTIINYHLFTETKGNSVFCGPETAVVAQGVLLYSI